MSPLQAALHRAFTRALTSPALLQRKRQWQAVRRKALGRTAQVHYFHQMDDPYSHLAAQQLAALAARYRIELVAHLVNAPDPGAAPDLQRLGEWSARDAQRMASACGLPAPDFRLAPSAARLQEALPLFAAALAQPDMPQRLAALSTALWQGTPLSGAGQDGSAAALRALDQGSALRRQLGHYLGATFYFEGEWYWGLDRLHYLEQRLQEATLARDASLRTVLVPARTLQFLPVASASPARPTLHFYCSLRSPYTHLAARQARQLAEHYGADLQLRFVLPMVMRGLPVPLSKRLYIMRDTKREADRLGIGFGCVVDPVGAPTERGLALLHHAIARGKGEALAESFLQGVFADGLDAGSDSGLLHIAERAGLQRADMVAALADPSWRDVAEANRQDMLAHGLWGVPSFRVDARPAVWGQDRLWMVEQDLIAALQAHAS